MSSDADELAGTLLEIADKQEFERLWDDFIRQMNGSEFATQPLIKAFAAAWFNLGRRRVMSVMLEQLKELEKTAPKES